MRKLLSMLMAATAMLSVLTVSASAADYSFSTEAPADYYGNTSYEEIYGSQYNYGGPNVVDYQETPILYGSPSTTQTGVMEKGLLPGLQQNVIPSTGGYGIGGEVNLPVVTVPGPTVSVQTPAITLPPVAAFTTASSTRPTTPPTTRCWHPICLPAITTLSLSTPFPCRLARWSPMSTLTLELSR